MEKLNKEWKNNYKERRKSLKLRRVADQLLLSIKSSFPSECWRAFQSAGLVLTSGGHSNSISWVKSSSLHPKGRSQSCLNFDLEISSGSVEAGNSFRCTAATQRDGEATVWFPVINHNNHSLELMIFKVPSKQSHCLYNSMKNHLVLRLSKDEGFTVSWSFTYSEQFSRCKPFFFASYHWRYRSPHDRPKIAAQNFLLPTQLYLDWSCAQLQAWTEI